MMLQKATEFYNLDEEKLQQYINTSHKPKESAVKHLINEYLEGTAALDIKQRQFTVYECNFCDNDKKYYQLRDFESHCYYNGHNHRDANLERIKDDAIRELADANAQMEKEIYSAGQAANKAAFRAAAENKRIADEKAKKDPSLPFVK